MQLGGSRHRSRSCPAPRRCNSPHPPAAGGRLAQATHGPHCGRANFHGPLAVLGNSKLAPNIRRLTERRRAGDRVMGWMAPLRHLSAKLLSDRISSEWEPSMGEVTTIGLDLAKHVFQVHGVDAEGATVLRKQLRRAQVLGFFRRLPRCLVGHVGLELRNVDANYPFE